MKIWEYTLGFAIGASLALGIAYDSKEVSGIPTPAASNINPNVVMDDINRVTYLNGSFKTISGLAQ